MTLSFCLECIQLAPPSCRPIGKLGALLFSVLDVFLQDILWTSHVKMTCQALGLNNRSLEHPSVKVCCEVELHRHPVRSDSLQCSFSFTLVVLYVTAVWPAFARLINYNNKDVHSATGQTPYKARDKDNEFKSRLNTAMKAKKQRLYPELSVGDKVKIKRKKATTEKERTSHFLKGEYTVESIDEKLNQTYYRLEGYNRPLLRHELLNI